jgi:hypothetical protein
MARAQRHGKRQAAAAGAPHPCLAACCRSRYPSPRQELPRHCCECAAASHCCCSQGRRHATHSAR